MPPAALRQALPRSGRSAWPLSRWPRGDVGDKQCDTIANRLPDPPLASPNSTWPATGPRRSSTGEGAVRQGRANRPWRTGWEGAVRHADGRGRGRDPASGRLWRTLCGGRSDNPQQGPPESARSTRGRDPRSRRRGQELRGGTGNAVPRAARAPPAQALRERGAGHVQGHPACRRRGGVSPAARLPYYCNCAVPRAVPPGGVRPGPVKPLF